MFAVEAAEPLPLQLRVSHSHHRVILLSQIKIKITLIHPLAVTCFPQLPQNEDMCFT